LNKHYRVNSSIWYSGRKESFIDFGGSVAVKIIGSLTLLFFYYTNRRILKNNTNSSFQHLYKRKCYNKNTEYCYDLSPSVNISLRVGLYITKSFSSSFYNVLPSHMIL